MSRDKIWHLFSRKLTGEASQEELFELNQLSEDHPALYQQMEAIQQLWNLEEQVDRDYLEATYHLHYQKMKKLGVEPKHIDEVEITSVAARSSFFSTRAKKFAFVAIAAVISVTVFLFMNRKEVNVEVAKVNSVESAKLIATKNGVNTKFNLPDGSVVWLNAGSKLDYTKIGETGNREVYLTGEAFFDVVKNAQRPFIIHTNNIDVKVLGTRFNVKAYPNDKTIETSLVQGSVEVFVKNRPGEKYLLKPNQKLVLLNDPEAEVTQKQEAGKNLNLPIIAIRRLTYPKDDSVAIETSWTRNKLVFEKESFAEIARKMERWYDVRIEFKNPDLEEEQLNGSFEKETLAVALKALQFTTDFDFKIEGRTVIIY